jgi:hypothetical protein
MRRILLSSLSACSYLLVQSQTFTPEVGLNYMVQPTLNYNLSSYGVTYAPRLNFWEDKNSAWSLGFPLSFGWSDLKSPHFAVLDLPAEVDYNIGAGSIKVNKKRLGFFVGAGYGFHVTVVHFYPSWSSNPPIRVAAGYFPIRNTYNGAAAHINSPISSFGPTLNMGFRLAVGHTGKIIEFRFSYMKVLEVPEMLQDQFLYKDNFRLQNTIILGFGCLFSF